MDKLVSHKLSCGCEIEIYMHGMDQEQVVKHCNLHASTRALYNALKLFEKNEMLSKMVALLDPMASRQVLAALREAEEGLSEEEIKALSWHGGKFEVKK